MRILKIVDWVAVEDFLKYNSSAPTHWPDWNLIISKHYGTDFYYFAAYEDAELIGICPIHSVKKGITNILQSGQFHYIPYGGWIFNKKTVVDDLYFPIHYNEALTGFALPGIKRFAADWQLKKNSKLSLTLCIDLEKDVDWLWMNDIDAKRRNMIRKAKNNKLRTEVVGKGNFSDFYNLYHHANERNGLTSMSSACLSELFIATANVSFLGMLAKQGERSLSAIAVVYDKDFALYWLGAGTSDSPNLGQGELLQWEAINYAKKMGCKIYDLCFIEKERLPAIYEFKKGFAKSEYPIAQFAIKPLGYRVLNKLLK